jgi:hypothetical protein
MRLVPSYQSIMFAPVSGSVDTTYVDDWLTNGLPGFPVKKTGGSLSLTVSPSPAVMVDTLAIVNHKVKAAASVSVSGSISTTIPTAAWEWDDIPVGWFRLLAAPVSASSLVLAVSGNSDPVIIGEFYAGLSIVFPGMLHGIRFAPGHTFPWEGEFASLAPFDSGVAPSRRMAGNLILTAAQHAQLVSAHASQRNGSRPVLFINDDDVNDAWLAQFDFESDKGEGYYFVSLEVVEIPRTRW